MSSAPQVGIVGLNAFLRDMKRLSIDTSPLNPALRAAGRAAATPIAEVARSTIPRDSGDLSGDVRVTASRTGAAVRMGRSSIPYAGWVEFGGTRRAPRVSERDYNARGRYLFPAADNLSSQAARLYADALGPALDAFAWSNTTNDPGSVHD
jgi:hypothetical protein